MLNDKTTPADDEPLGRPVHIFQPDTGPRAESPSVKLTAASISKKPIDLAGRKPIRAYAVDGANPKTPMDRDDAVNIEFHDDPVLGKLVTLHATIADVASVSPGGAMVNGDARLTALDNHAANNGETLYFSHGVAPMLPRTLQDRLSLEDGKERAGLTISITFDSKCNAIHTEFSRTRVTTECKSYRGAAIDIQSHGHPIQRIAVLAGQLLKNKTGLTNLPHYDEATGCYTDSEGVERHVSPDELSAYAMVQGCMIAANEAAAKMMQGSNFVFRNHSFLFTPKGGEERVVYEKAGIADAAGNARGRLEPNQAEYSAKNIGHFGLDSPAYSHVTSPIRRYADLVNQRMMHWGIDVVDAVVSVAASGSKVPEEKIRYIMWDHAPELLEKASHYKQGDKGAAKIKVRRELVDSIHSAFKACGVKERFWNSKTEEVIEAVQMLQMPYKHNDLVALSSKLNHTLSGNRVRRRDFSETTAWINTVFPNTDAALLSEWSAGSFARLLEAAARRGDNNDVFAAQVRQRITMGMKAFMRQQMQTSGETNPEKGLEDTELGALVQNLYSLIVLAEQRKDGHWEELKDFAFQQLKDQPVLAEQLFEFLQMQQLKQYNSVLQTPQGDGPEQQLVRETKQSYVVQATLFDRQKHSVPAALVVLSHELITPRGDGLPPLRDRKDYSAPVIDAVDPGEYASAEEATKVARQSAILTFFRYYGKMYHHEDLYTPPLIEMELERAKVKKGDRLEFLHKVCDGLFEVECMAKLARSPYNDAKTFKARVVVRPKDGEPLVTEAIGPLERAIDKAAQKMLFYPPFREMLSATYEPVDMLDKAPLADEPKLVWGKAIAFDRTRSAENGATR